MADDSKLATLRSNMRLGTNQVATAVTGPVMLDSTIEVAAAASAGSVYTMIRVPVSARINGLSRVAWDDLASTGSPTIGLGFKPVGANFTANAAALTDSLDVAASASSAPVVKDIANYGKRVWELLGLSDNPGGFADVTITIAAAATNTGGTITLSLLYTVD